MEKEKLFDLYVRILAARNRHMQATASGADAFRRNVTGPERDLIDQERHDALWEYHNLGMEWLELVGLKPKNEHGGVGMKGIICAYEPPIFEETIRLPGE